MKVRLLFLIAMLVAMPVHAQTAGTQTQQQRPYLPSTNLKFTFYLIQADGFPNDDADIRPIVVELRKIFKFSGYRLGSKSVLQAATMEGTTHASGKQVITDPDGDNYVIVTDARVSQDNTLFLQVELRQGTMGQGAALIDASVSVKDGKTVVLGSAMGGKDKAIILAVTPTIEH